VCLHSWYHNRGVGGNLSSKFDGVSSSLDNVNIVRQTTDIPTRHTRRSTPTNPATEMSFIRAMQFALTEYICVSSEETEGSLDDDIHACAFDFFHKQVIFNRSSHFSSYLNYILFRPVLRSPWEVVDIRNTQRLPIIPTRVQNV
jgi:hypothetical protein